MVKDAGINDAGGSHSRWAWCVWLGGLGKGLKGSKFSTWPWRKMVPQSLQPPLPTMAPSLAT
jgi:hypothetical protein